MAPMLVHVGVDVGGTNTDAVVMGLSPDSRREVVISSAKQTTTADVTSGFCRALTMALDRAAETLQSGKIGNESAGECLIRPLLRPKNQESRLM